MISYSQRLQFYALQQRRRKFFASDDGGPKEWNEEDILTMTQYEELLQKINVLQSENAKLKAQIAAIEVPTKVSQLENDEKYISLGSATTVPVSTWENDAEYIKKSELDVDISTEEDLDLLTDEEIENLAK